MASGETEYLIPEHYGNKISTVDNEGKRKWIYAFKPKGKFYKYRTWLSWFYMALLFGLPFVKINGKPFLLLNIPKGEFILFGKMFFPQDFIILGIGMVLAIVFVIVFTLLFGRVFCGWVCPQTIFLEMMFRKIEFMIEGPAHVQMKAKKQKIKPKSYYFKKTLKHIVFYLLSFLIAMTFLSYIVGIDVILSAIKEPTKHWIAIIGLLAFATVFYFVYAYVREIACTVICPYGRMQSTLMDKKSMAVAYNYNRGEPRGRKRKGKEDELGDCIDCGMCVNVCPTGIDIRDGLQMECVNCTACIDACDDMMRRVNKPERLITFATEHQLETNTVGEKSLDLRSKLLLTLLIVLTAGFTAFMVTLPVFDSTVLRVPGQLYQEGQDGTISNLYKIKIQSKSPKDLPYSLAVKEENAQIEFVGTKLDSLKSGQLSEEIFFVRFPKGELEQRKTKINIQIKSGDKVIQNKKVTFLNGY